MTRRVLAAAALAALWIAAAPAQKQQQQPPAQKKQQGKAAPQAKVEQDPLMNAMLIEMARARELQFPSLEAPYFIEYAVDDLESFSASASLGGMLGVRRTRVRLPRIQVRIGTYNLDNTNFVLTDFFTGGGAGTVPLDNKELPLRQYFWLATDNAYKAAFEAFARKRAAMAYFVSPERLDDFSKVQTLVKIENAPRQPADEAFWTNRVRSLSTVFANYPKIIGSEVGAEIGHSIAYLLTSEGTAVKVPDNLSFVRMTASAQAADGSTIQDAVLFQALDAARLPDDEAMRRAALELAERVSALAAAPAGENYVGPVLFEGTAAAQLFAQLLGRNLAMVRTPVALPNRPAPVLQSELEGRVGARVLPEWMGAVDDPTQTEWRGRQLLGHYEVDLEGVVPGPVKVVDLGNLINVLMTRQPVKGFSTSNGRARLPGNFGAKSAAISNLFLTASKTAPAAELKKQLIEMAQKRNKPYGLLIRKLDFPSSASLDELQRISAAAMQSGSVRAVSSPILAYKVYPDGREELVRGLRFRALSVRSLREIAAASEESYLFDFVNNGALFAAIGGSNYVTGSAVVAPAVLFDDLDLERPQEDKPSLPLAPPPAVGQPR